MDGREPDVMLTRRVVNGDWRNGGAQSWRLNARARRHQPTQDKLNQ